MSIQFIQNVTAHYTREVDAIGVGGLLDPASVAPLSPFSIQLQLNKLAHDIPLLLESLDAHHSNKHYPTLHLQLTGLMETVDEKQFINARHLAALEKPPQVVSEEVPIAPATENESELRQRLLLDSTYSKLDAVENNNAYHESFQEDILSDLTDLATTLKNLALSLSSKIIDDTKILAQTSDSLYANESLMKSVGSTLDDYVMNKSGGKISFWFLLRVMVSVVLLFLLMVLLTRVLPKM